MEALHQIMVSNLALGLVQGLRSQSSLMSAATPNCMACLTRKYTTMNHRRLLRSLSLSPLSLSLRSLSLSLSLRSLSPPRSLSRPAPLPPPLFDDLSRSRSRTRSLDRLRDRPDALSPPPDDLSVPLLLRSLRSRERLRERERLGGGLENLKSRVKMRFRNKTSFSAKVEQAQAPFEQLGLL